jgi:uncharacterized protein DUF5681
MAKSSTTFEKGQSGNPNGRPKTVALLADLAREHTAEAIQTLVQLMKTGAGNVRVMAANAILDRGWGKPAQTITATVNEKRSALDWTTDELVTYISERRAARERVIKKDANDTEPDSVPENPFADSRASTHKWSLVKSGWSLSALPPKAGICQRIEHVCFVP